MIALHDFFQFETFLCTSRYFLQYIQLKYTHYFLISIYEISFYQTIAFIFDHNCCGYLYLITFLILLPSFTPYALFYKVSSINDVT